MKDLRLLPVEFAGSTLVLVDRDHDPFVAMRSVVQGIGLAWAPQYTKICEKFSETVTIIDAVAEDGMKREMVCLPLRKLAAWLYTISPSKVSPHLRDKVIHYQEECDDVLWKHFKGETHAAMRTLPEASGMSLSQQVAASRHTLDLIERLRRTKDQAQRDAMYERLCLFSAALGVNVPDLELMTPPTNSLQFFWDAIQYLEARGVPINHSRNPEHVAISCKQFLGFCRIHGIAMPERMDLLKHMRAAGESYLGPKPVLSPLEKRMMKCQYIVRPMALQ